MRRITVVGMIILGLVAVPLIAAAKPAPEKKVEICHFDDDGIGHVINVSVKALPAHLAHEDYAIDGSNSVEGCGTEVPPTGTGTPAPTADFTSLSTCVDDFIGITCTLALDGNASTGQIDTYIWYVTGDQTSPRSAAGATAQIEGLPRGTYQIDLSVSGPGGSATTTGSVTIP
ncbi:MAG TPA: hypothetical protein VLT15_06130 [Acidimicrobiia bacterium]|nr:hypothetical protein [Acidimicrobiia bacterium]